MTPEQERFLAFYEEHRRGAQSAWYRRRYTTYEEAHRQSVTLTTVVLFLSSVVSIVSVRWERPNVWGDLYIAWPVLAAVLAAAGTAIAAYRSLYGFQENARLYRDAENALAAVLADSPVECRDCAEASIQPGDYVAKVEEVFRREQGQWGQLVAQIKAVTVPAPETQQQNGPPPAGGNRRGDADNQPPNGGNPPPAPPHAGPGAGRGAAEEEEAQPAETPANVHEVPPEEPDVETETATEAPPADTPADEAAEAPPADAGAGAGSAGDEEEPPPGGGAPGAVG